MLHLVGRSIGKFSRNLNLGCLHPVARVRTDDVGFNPSTQRHYRRLIYYLYVHSYMFRSCDHRQAEHPKRVAIGLFLVVPVALKLVRLGAG
jgi:hypothetical protein